MGNENDFLAEFLMDYSSEEDLIADILTESSEDEASLPAELTSLPSGSSRSYRKGSVKTYVEHTVPHYSDAEFETHFRVTREQFEFLCEKFRKSSEFQCLDSTKCYPPTIHIILFLWFTGHEACSYRDLANCFDLALGTVCFMIERVISFLCNLSDEVITWPTAEEQEETMEIMREKTGFPAVIGALGSTNIGIEFPKKSKNDNIDRKNGSSICLQAICDEKGRFRDIFICFPGSERSSSLLANSDIYPKLPYLCRNRYILADSAYRCTKYVITPFRNKGQLTRQQNKFNCNLNSGRMLIEHAFGVFKQRFRQVNHCKLRGVDKISKFIRACVVLHNLFCESSIETFYASSELNVSDWQALERDDEDGSNLRAKLCKEMR